MIFAGWFAHGDWLIHRLPSLSLTARSTAPGGRSCEGFGLLVFYGSSCFYRRLLLIQLVIRAIRREDRDGQVSGSR